MDITRKFTNAYNDLIDFNESQVGAAGEDNVHCLQALRVHLDSIWTQVKRCYEDCRDHDAKEGEAPVDLIKLRSHYRTAISVYESTLGIINSEIDALTNKATEPLETTVQDNSVRRSIKLPPCDTDVFYGSYKTWPTFRDLFSAIYVENSGISRVEKLYHLKQKTSGEARDIIAHIPLTHDGFDLAWKNLTDRYENKRMQVNEQLKTLFSLPAVTVDSSSSLKSLQRSVNGCLETLKTLDIDIATWDPILIYLCSQKIPRTYLQDFENTLSDSSTIPKWKDFDKFLTQRFKTLESVGNIQPSTSQSAQLNKENHRSQKDKRINSFQTNVDHNSMNNLTSASNRHSKSINIKCQYCQKPHLLRNCPKFLIKNINDRIHVVKVTNTCYNCLLTDHGVSECKSKFNCRHCNLRHHTLLHKGNEPQTSFETPLDVRPSTSTQALTTTLQSTPNIEPKNLTSLALRDENRPQSKSEETLLFTALVEVESNGQRFEARAIIDSGSQSTFISEKLKNRLRLPTKRNLVHVSGLNPAMMETSTQACIFTIRSRLDPEFKLDVWAPVLKTLSFSLPPRNLDIDNYDDLDHPLADPYFHKSRPVDILIGLDICSNIFDFAVPMRSHGSLLTQKTVFGWIVGGPVERSTQSPSHVSLFNAVALDNLLTQFWEVEETPSETLRSKEDIFCENLYKSTTSRTASGRYVVNLPFKTEENIGHSRNIAMAQYLRMEKILSSKPDVKDLYDKTIMEYLDLGTLLQLAEDIKDTYPLASQTLKNNMYVDDVLAGGHTVEEAITSRNQLNTALTSAGFELRKWASNNPIIISDISPEKLLSDDCLQLSENVATKTLGIKWNISSDSFSFPQPDITQKSSFTKREVLSVIARFFDPCGWLAPIIVAAKLIMQQIWLDKSGWDDGLKPLTSLAWENFLRNCPDIQHQRIPRWIQYTPSCKIDIHGFCDSSEKAFDNRPSVASKITMCMERIRRESSV
ncbi:uncharacterized protein [Musca autumnalis]|uniref:uncharacterized protein n=1 Tax=Musca autumnalis TaxID=221902 RepID=UPI003CF90AEC